MIPRSDGFNAENMRENAFEIPSVMINISCLNE